MRAVTVMGKCGSPIVTVIGNHAELMQEFGHTRKLTCWNHVTATSLRHTGKCVELNCLTKDCDYIIVSDI